MSVGGRDIVGPKKSKKEMPKDPVCGMTVDDKAALSSEHKGRVIYFCSQGCKNAFDRNPQKYVHVG